MRWVTSWRLPPVSVAASVMPCASTITLCLLPLLPRSTGDGPVFAPPFIARRCEPSTAARGKSNRPAARNSASSSCNAWHTPAWCQSRSLRRHVLPEPYPNSGGRNSQVLFVVRITWLL